MHTVAFALTKIQPPRARAGLVERPSLEQRLDEALAHARLVLLSAPAGCGKTSALMRQLARQDGRHAVAWISADEQDNLGRFVACLVGALEPFDPPWRIAPTALLDRPDGTRAAIQALSTELVDALAATEVARGVVVIDDLHRVDDPQVFVLLDAVLERLPPQWTVAVGTRLDPPLALARLRARGELAEFRQVDLRFEADEVEALLRQPGAQTPVSAHELLERTQGWAAGLRLSLSTAGRAAPSHVTQRHVFEYLASEVLDGMPPELREFLLRCSVLPELSGARCAAVSGDALAAQRLEEIERRGLFVSVLDEMPLTLRLHDLFRDFLQHRLLRDHPDMLPSLLARAAAGEPDPVRQVDLLLRAGDSQAAQRALAAAAPTMLLEGASAQVLRLVERFAPALREASPVLAFVRGLVAWPRFEWATMHKAMARAGEGFDTLGMAGPAQQARAFESVALTALGRLDEAAARLAQVSALPMERDTAALVALMSYWQSGARGPAGEAAVQLGRLVDLLGHDAPASLWYRCTPHFLFVGRRDMRAPMERFAHRAIGIAGEHHAPLRAGALCLSAWLKLLQGSVDEAARLIRQAQDDDRWLGQPRNLRITILAFLSALHALRGEREAFRAAAREMLADVDKDPERRATWRGVYLYQVSRLAVSLDDRAFADETRSAVAETPTAHEWPFMRFARAELEAEQALHRGDAARARDLLEPLVDGVADHDMISTEAALRIALARAHGRLGNEEAAWRALAPALAQADASGEFGALLFAGPQALAELARLRWPPGTPVHVLVRLAEQAAVLRRRDPVAARVPAAPVNVLSAREMEVLARIAGGDSNKLIARALDLSPHTVKRHVANILDKLAVGSRGQAAAWHRQNVQGSAGSGS